MSRLERHRWILSKGQRQRGTRSRAKLASRSSSWGRRLRFEPLEDRQMLSITVNTLVDELDGSVVDGDVSLRDALLATSPFETINFDPSLFFGGPATLQLKLGDLRITKDVTINGPGFTLLTIDASGNDLTPSLDNGDGSRVFSVNNNSAFTNIDVTITDMQLTGGDVLGDGGGIRNLENLTCTNLVVFGNSSRHNGGGISSSGSLTLITSNITGNSAVGTGGGVSSSGPYLTIHASTIAQNAAAGGAGVFTGADGSYWSVSDSTISGNSAAGRGGGLYSLLGNGRITNSKIYDNSATGKGGGIYSEQSAVVTVDSTISGNTAGGAGGGIYAQHGSLTINTSTLSGNNTSDDGGGVSMHGGVLSMLESTISGNNAQDDAGGLRIGTDPGQTTTISQSTITANRADADLNGAGLGGGIVTDIDAKVSLISTIVAGNFQSAGVAPDIFGKVTAAYSLIGNNFGASITNNGGNLIGTAAAPIDALLGPLADNGGPTLTHLPQVGSPVVDKGDPSAVAGVNVPLYDQRGSSFSRVFDGDGNTLARIDIGAVELLLGAIQGQKWNDVNGNAFKDFNEPGLAGWTIYLDTNANGQLDAGERSTTTDGDGNYAFNSLVPGTYVVGEVPQTNWRQTFPGSALSGNVAVFNDPSFVDSYYYYSDSYDEQATLASLGATVSTFVGTSGPEWAAGLAGKTVAVIPDQDYGFLSPALSSSAVLALRNFVADGGGLIINGSYGYTGRTAALLNSVFGFNTTENYAGNFTFGRTSAAIGTAFSADTPTLYPNYGTNALVTSSLPAGALSLYESGGETAIALMNYGSGKIVFMGWDWYAAAPLGYQDGGWVQTLGSAVEEVGASHVPGTHTVIVQPGEVTAGIDFGNQALPGMIRGEKWNDLNANGVKDAGEPGLPGWTIYLDTNTNGSFDFDELSTTTDADGNYLFSAVQPGTYIVGEVNQTGWQQTFPGRGVVRTVTVHSLDDISGIDFGNHARPGSINGQKWNDLNGDGVKEAGEPGLSGWTIYLDSNFNGNLEPGERSTTTDVDGYYSFTNLIPGVYAVTEVSQAGWEQIFPGLFANRTVMVDPGQDVFGIDFGNRALPGTIRGQKWNDVNANGVKDVGEPGLAGWTIYLDKNGNGIFDSITGVVEPDSFSIGTVLNNLTPGVSLSVSGFSGASVTASNGFGAASTGSQVLGNSVNGQWYTEVRLRADFALPTDFVSIDAVSDDSFDLGRLEAYDASNNLIASYDTSALTSTGQFETMTVSRPQHDIAYVLASGLNGEVINLDNLRFGSTEPATTTDANGNYVFSVPPGTYSVGEVPQPDWLQTFPGSNALRTVTVHSLDDIAGIDFGNHAMPGSIQGQKWSDLNGNGRKDAGEPGLVGWTIYLDTNGNGSLDFGEPSTTTDVGGNYMLSNVTPGTYLVREVPKVGWQQTFPVSVSVGKVSVFDDPSFVDTIGGTTSESDNVQATLSSLGASVSTFVGISGPQWTTELAGTGIVLIPEQENGSLSASLSSDAATALRNFVGAGGGLIVNGTYGSSNTALLLNSVFGFATSEGTAGLTFTQTLAANGTAFSADAFSLPPNNGTNALATSSLPAGALSLYEASGQTAIALLKYGSGKIVFLGWDWFEAAPAGSQDGGWIQALNSAVLEVGLSGVPGTHTVTVHPSEAITGIDFGNQGLLGDYNHNGVVDAADYTVWRDTFSGHITAFTGADGSGNGIVDAADYALWKTHFGEKLTAGAGSGAGVSVSTAGGAAVEHVAPQILVQVVAPIIGATAEPSAATTDEHPVLTGFGVSTVAPTGLVTDAMVIGLPTSIRLSGNPTYAVARPLATNSPNDDGLLAWFEARSDVQPVRQISVNSEVSYDWRAEDSTTDRTLESVDEAFAALTDGV
jgi:predicted outer membrane repeat protein